MQLLNLLILLTFPALVILLLVITAIALGISPKAIAGAIIAVATICWLYARVSNKREKEKEP